MSVAVFDTYAFVKRLTTAGMREARAEQRRLIDDRLATKGDIAKSESATRAEIAKLELTIRLSGMVMALGGFLVAIKLLAH